MIRQAGHRLFFRVVGIFSDPLVILTKAHVRNLQAFVSSSGFRQVQTSLDHKCKLSRSTVNRIPAMQTLRFQSTAQGSGGGVGTVEAGPQESGKLMAKVIKVLRVIASPLVKRTVLIGSARNMYECCVDGMNFEEFFIACELPDTFQSWFAILHLHIWMCLVRLKPEGKDGRYMYRKLVQMMWVDVEERIRNLGTIDSVVQRDSLRALVRQFYGLTIAYDEGLLSDDTVLATALWRNLFYDKKHTDAEQLGCLVEYVRKNVHHLENLGTEQLMCGGNFKWLPFKEKENKDAESQ